MNRPGVETRGRASLREMRFLFLILFILSGFIAQIHSRTIVMEGYRSNTMITVVRPDSLEPGGIVWVFHGYQPSGDPYRQNPRWIIRKWKLEKLSEKLDVMFVLPDLGNTVYPLYQGDSIHADFTWLKDEHRKICGEFSNQLPEMFTGISTGVEGAVKFASLFAGRALIVSFSGTYDYNSLDTNGGEYRIHLKSFGDDPAVWEKENPVSILRRMHSKIYIFSEERSIYSSQASRLFRENITNAELVDNLNLGKGMLHNWNFWSKPEVMSGFEEAILTNIIPQTQNIKNP